MKYLRFLADMAAFAAVIAAYTQYAMPALVGAGWVGVAVVNSVAIPCALALVIVIRNPWLVGAR